MIQQTTQQIITQLKETILTLTPTQYIKPLEILNGSSIGMHVRHILEFYQCLIISIDTGVVHYDARKRELKLETQPEYAIQLVDEIIVFMEAFKGDIKLLLKAGYCYQNESKQIEVATNLNRELIYNIEHMVHHLAIIKIGLKELDPVIVINKHMGVAPSTIRNKNICAQ